MASLASPSAEEAAASHSSSPPSSSSLDGSSTPSSTPFSNGSPSSSSGSPPPRKRTRSAKPAGTRSQPLDSITIPRTSLPDLKVLLEPTPSYNLSTLFSPQQLSSLSFTFLASVTFPIPDPSLLTYYLKSFPAIPTGYITPSSLCTALSLAPSPPSSPSFCGLPLPNLLDHSRNLLDPRHSTYARHRPLYDLLYHLFLLRKPPPDHSLPNPILADAFLCLCFAKPYPFYDLIYNALQLRSKRFKAQSRSHSTTFYLPSATYITFFLSLPASTKPRRRRHPSPPSSSTRSAPLPITQPASTSPTSSAPTPNPPPPPMPPMPRHTPHRSHVVADSAARLAALPSSQQPFRPIRPIKRVVFPMPPTSATAVATFVDTPATVTTVPLSSGPGAPSSPSTPAPSQPLPPLPLSPHSPPASPSSPSTLPSSSQPSSLPQPPSSPQHSQPSSLPQPPSSPQHRRASRNLYGAPSSATLNLRYPRAETTAADFNAALSHIDEGIFRLTRSYNDHVGALRDLRQHLRLALADVAERDVTITGLRSQIHSLEDRLLQAEANNQVIHSLRTQVADLETRLAASETAAATHRADADSLRQWQASLAALLQPLHSIAHHPVPNPPPPASSPPPTSSSANLPPNPST